MKSDEKILAYYNQGLESARLSGESPERLRTESILRRLLPKPPAMILDVGGADGVYAFPLARAGYEVHLVDPIPLHIRQGRERAETSGVQLASIREGDARKLEFADSSADAVLFLGPLYHLCVRTDRLAALREAHRTLKQGGVFLGAFISRYASLLDGLRQDWMERDEFAAIVRQDLQNGEHRNPTSNPFYFTDTQFHHPDEARAELKEAGFEDVHLLAVEGPTWLVSGIENQLSRPRTGQRIMEFLEQIERESSLIGVSAHFIGAAQRRR
jgi:ubiquinone/menaquinone biosynthesis C-methylase UbiE